MKKLDDFLVKNQRFLIRVDFNVPISDSLEITDDTRIRVAIPTIQKIISNGGSVVLMSHMGRPKNKESNLSMRHLVSRLSGLLSTPVKFIDQCIGNKVVEVSEALQPGEILLIENLRFYAEETSGDLNFAEQLSKLGDVYVNDAFGSAHRNHASTSVIAQFFSKKKCFGYVMENEIKNINKLMSGKNKPFTAIVGGAKVSSKITVIIQMLEHIDNLIIGGGMAYTFVKAMGGEVASSIVEEDKLGLALQIIETARSKGVCLYIPSDSINADKFDDNANKNQSPANKIPNGNIGLDIGPKTIKQFSKIIAESSTILWNGPMGVFEMKSFEHGTKAIAQALVDATTKGAFTLIGGGDSVAAINKYNMSDKVSYISTGGGALLEYLEGLVLPGIKAIVED